MPKAATQIRGPGVDDVFEVGEEVDKSKFSDSEWDALLEAGAIEGQGADVPGEPNIAEDMRSPEKPASKSKQPAQG